MNTSNLNVKAHEGILTTTKKINNNDFDGGNQQPTYNNIENQKDF